MKRIVRFGFAPDWAMRRAASIIGPMPVPQSIPPVAESNESKCPETMTYSSGYFVPRIEAIILW